LTRNGRKNEKNFTFNYIFVTWKLDENNIPALFLAGIDLVESDWKMSNSKNYYATTYGKKELYSNNDKVTF